MQLILYAIDNDVPLDNNIYIYRWQCFVLDGTLRDDSIRWYSKLIQLPHLSFPQLPRVYFGGKTQKSDAGVDSSNMRNQLHTLWSPVYVTDC